MGTKQVIKQRDSKIIRLRKLVESYVRHTVITPNKINIYVPNSHIGETFCEVLEMIDYFESGEHDIFNQYNFIEYVSEVFANTITTDDVVHSSYQILREKGNNLRNFMMLAIIEDDTLMPKRVKNNMFDRYKKLEKGYIKSNKL